MNLLAEVVAASRDERLNMMEDATSLRTLGKTLRAKSEDLRKRNRLLLRKAEAANRRYFEISKLFGATTIPEVEYVTRLAGSGSLHLE